MARTQHKVLIVGSGWAGSTLCSNLSTTKHDITVISPSPTTPYTPLLASAACGLYDFSLVETPVRHESSPFKFIQGKVRTIDFEKKTCRCRPFFSDLEDERFELSYDIIILAPGCLNQTFGTPGVLENACFVRNVADAMLIRQRVADCFEKASLPGRTEQEQHDLLHFVIVGGGPTGIELSAELCDLFKHSFAKLYPHLKAKPSIAIHDVAPNILSVFDAKLQDYALASFSKRGVEVVTSSHIQRVDADSITTVEHGRIPTGLVIWATGNRCTRLVESLPVKLTPRLPRIVTDSFLRVYGKDEQILPDAYALGDAADIQDASLPTTAEVACQKAEYLAKCLNKGHEAPFKYQQKAVVAYLGQRDGVVAGDEHNLTGQRAWMAWRSKNFWWTRSWRQKVFVVVAWALDWLVGRGIAPV
ncbi:uncharacterized protein KY384_007140 [Bacidia gigantensis]|uniref:uncharacterized protein n=1 Tax=Bacidia gigantensis TaxID=2732470 RepID=UPI001D046014|nr:uncharacterized protein KY384_007140 [Bacidia gigantensis]KAG8528223.1 hypothetical protein KY384_007140 [Bacidia gigantensis]